jgi:hypothetical protein
VNRSYPEGKRLLLCISTGHVTLADSIKPFETAQRKPSKDGTNGGVAGAEHRDHPDQLRQEVGPSKERSATASNGRVARGELIARKVLASEWFGMQDGAETLEGLSGPGVGLVPSADSAKRAPIETLWCSGRDYDL